MARTPWMVVASAVILVCAAALGADMGAGRTPALARTYDAGVAVLPPVTGTLPPVVSGPASAKTGLATSLDQLYRADVAARAGQGPITSRTTSGVPASVLGMLQSKLLRVDGTGRVQVFAHASGDVAAAEGDLVSLGMHVDRVDAASGIIEGMLPIASIPAAAALPSVSSLRPPERPIVAIGSGGTTQGDAILGSAQLRSTLGVSGKGVRVGVISDGMEGMAASQASGDLPSSVDTTTCNVVPATGSPPGQPQPTDAGAGAEGTAMLEIVHDIVPNAQLYFGYFGFNVAGAGTSLDFNAAVNCLAANADVVIDDIGWFNVGPYDGSSSVSMNTTNALNNPANRIRGYYTAVANQATNHYREAYASSGLVIPGAGSDSWTIHRFASSSNTTDAGFGLLCTSTPGVFCGDAVQVAPGGSFSVNLQWNDPFGNSTNDYDLLLFDPNDTTGGPGGTLFLASADAQNGAGFNPTESFGYINVHGITTTYYIIIGNYKGLAATRTFDMFVNCSGCFSMGGNAHNFNTVSRSVPNESDAAGGVMSLGAIAASDPGNDTIEPYSSRGPAGVNTKPDATAIDGVTVTGNGGFPNPFFGTSAAAPHAGAIAAMLLSCNPMLLAGSPTGTPASNRTTLRNAMLNSAVDLGVAGVDNTYGFGRLNAVAAAPLAGCVDTDGDGYPDGVETAMGKDPNSYCAIMRADVDGDGKVTILDLTRLAQFFTQTIPPAPARLNQDGDAKITVLDLTIVASQFLKSVSSCS